MSEYTYAQKQAFQRRFMTALLDAFPKADRYALFALLVILVNDRKLHFYDAKALLFTNNVNHTSDGELLSLLHQLAKHSFEGKPICKDDLTATKVFVEYCEYLTGLINEHESIKLPILRMPHRWRGTQSFLGVKLVTNLSAEAKEATRGNLKIIHSLNKLNSIGYSLNADITSLVNLDYDLGDGLSRVKRLENFKLNQETDTFYFLHNYDKRGRMLAVQYYGLSTQGDNFAKALFQYSKAKTLGETGYKAMLLALAESLMDKSTGAASYEQKIQYATTTGLSKARQASEANADWEVISKLGFNFTTYAIAMDILRAEDSGNLVTYESCIIIHQDATASGFQIAAALARDEKLASLTNLTSSSTATSPKDLYLQFVGTLIQTNRVQELTDIADRKLGKTVLMPAGYGASAQTLTKALYENYDLDIKLFNTIKSALNEAIEQTAGSLLELTKLLQQSIATEQMLTWKTADGFTAVHEPRSSEYRQTRLGRHTIKHPLGAYCYTEPLANGESDPIELGSNFYGGISPNFIHSIDATLARAIIEAAHEQGFNLTSIHDSFCTHACDAGLLNLSMRQAFKNTLEYDWLAAFSHANGALPIDLTMGNYSLDEALSATYMFTID